MNEYILIYSDGSHGSYYETIKGDNVIALSSNLLGNKKTTDEGYIPLTSEDYLNSVWNNILKDTKKGWALIDEEGKVYTWGYNEYGELGDGTTTQRLSPVQI